MLCFLSSVDIKVLNRASLFWWTSDVSEVHIPYYIMTSEGTHDETVAFWTTHAFFGIPQPDVFFFQQGMIPALDLQGKILLVRPRVCFFKKN